MGSTYLATTVYPVAEPFKNEAENNGLYSKSMRCKLMVGYSAVTCKLNMEGHLNKKRKDERGLKCNYYFESSCRLLLAVLYDLYLGRGGHEIFAIFGYFTSSCLIPTFVTGESCGIGAIFLSILE